MQENVTLILKMRYFESKFALASYWCINFYTGNLNFYLDRCNKL